MSKSSTARSAVMLSLLALVNGRSDQSEELALDRMANREEHREALIDVPADELKQMILSLLQDGEEEKDTAGKQMRPRKPDMRSPLETLKDERNKKSKFEKALEKREKEKRQANSAPTQSNEPFKNSDEYNKMSAFERSLEENRRQRQYLLEQYRQEGRIDEDQYMQAQEQAMDKRERRRRKKAAKAAQKYGLPMMMPGQPDPLYQPPMYGYGEYDDEDAYDSEDYDSELDSEENYDVLNDGPEQPRGPWVKDPIQMGDPETQQPGIKDWDEFDAQYEKAYLTPEEERQRELLQAKQEFFEELKREADFKKAHPEFGEDKPNKEAEKKLKQAEIPEEWKDLTPAQRQKKQNERHFAELQELKKAREGDDYKLPVPIKPESMKFTPSSDHDAEMQGSDDQKHSTDFSKPDDAADGPQQSADSKPEEESEGKESEKADGEEAANADESAVADDQQANALPGEENGGEPASNEADNGDDDLNPYERALRDNEKHKKRFVDELKKEAEERKRAKKEEEEAQAKADQEKREWLEQIEKDTGDTPAELAEIREEEEKKRQEEEAKKRPEPPSAKTMRERVAEESKRRKDAHMEKMRKEAEEEKAAKQAARDAETARRRLEDPSYEPPPPLTVPKGKPTPPPDYKYPEKARKHGFGPPLDPEEEKKEKEEQEAKEREAKEKKEKEEREAKEAKEAKERREREAREAAEHPKPKHHAPQPETKRPEPEVEKPAKKDKKKKKKKPAKKPVAEKEVEDAVPEKKKPKPEVQQEQPVKKPAAAKPAKKAKQPKQEEPEAAKDPKPSKDKKKKTKKKKRVAEPKPEEEQPQRSQEETERDIFEAEQPQQKEEPSPDLFIPADYQRHESEREPQQDPPHDRDSHQQYPDRQDEAQRDYGYESLDRERRSGQPNSEQHQGGSEQLSWPEHSDYDYQEDEYFGRRRQHSPREAQPRHLEPVVPHRYGDVGDVGRRPEPVLHYSTRKQDEAAEATPRSIYDEQFLQLDKKTGQEHGRLSEREQASSGFSSASSVGREPHYPRQTRRSGGHGYERDAEWHLDDYNHRRGGDRYARSDDADSRRARGYYQPYDSHLRRDEEEWRQQQQRGHASKPAYDSADRGYYGDRDGRYHRSYGDEEAYPWPAEPLPRQTKRAHRNKKPYSLDAKDERKEVAAELPWHSSDRSLTFSQRDSFERFEQGFGDRRGYQDHKQKTTKRGARKQQRETQRYEDDEWARLFYDEPEWEEDAGDGRYDRHQRGSRRQRDEILAAARRHDDLDLFKQSYDYREEADPYASSKRRQRRHRTDRDEEEYYRGGRRARRYHDQEDPLDRQPDYDLHRYYAEPETRPRRSRRSYSEEEYQRGRRHQPSRYENLETDQEDRRDEFAEGDRSPRQRNRRRHHHSEDSSRRRNTKKSDRKRKKAERKVKEAKPEPTAEQQPQKPAQQFVIPSMPRHDEEADSSSGNEEGEASSRGAGRPQKQPKEHVVPVMRRHGEPLMIMPENPSSGWDGQEEAYEDPFDSERRFFERESHPYRGYREDEAEQLYYPHNNRRHQYQNTALLESGQEADDLAHAMIDTFTQVVQPYPANNQGEELSVASDLAQDGDRLMQEQHETHSNPHRQNMAEQTIPVLQALESSQAAPLVDNKIQDPKFHYTKEGGVLKAQPMRNGQEEDSDDDEDDDSDDDSSSGSGSAESEDGSDSDSGSDSDEEDEEEDDENEAESESASESESGSEEEEEEDSSTSVEDQQAAEENDEASADLDFDDDVRKFYPGGEYEDYGEYYDYGEEDSGSEELEASSYDSEEIVDQFEKAMRMLRHRSHGFNLEATGSGKSDSNGLEVLPEFLSVKAKLKNGEHLESKKLVADWEPHAIQATAPITEAKKVTDYWFRSEHFGNQNSGQKPTTNPASSAPSLKELLANEEQLIADFERRIKEKEERRRAAETPGKRSDERTEHLGTNYEMVADHYPYGDHRWYSSDYYDYSPSVYYEYGPLYSHGYHDYPDLAYMRPRPIYYELPGAELPLHPTDQHLHADWRHYPANAAKLPSQDMREEMDYLQHQRMLKDRSMRRKREKQQPLPTAKMPPVPPVVPSRDKRDPRTGEPIEEGSAHDMMEYMKRQLQAKEREMLEKEKENPNYKPLSPTAHKPTAVPTKDQKKLQDAEEKKRAERQKRRQGEKKRPAIPETLKDKTLLDQIQEEKKLREQEKRLLDPSYEPLSPTAHPGKNPKKKSSPTDPEEKEDTVFEQMKRRRLEHEQDLREQDAKRAAEDPNYKPKFKAIPVGESPEDGGDDNFDLKRRLAEERRKHRQDHEEQFEDDLEEDGFFDDYEDDYYGDEYYDDEYYDDEYYDEGYSDPMAKEDLGRSTSLDYYYDEKGFAHPVKSKKKFGFERYPDAYQKHLDPRRNKKQKRYDEEESEYSSAGYSSGESENDDYYEGYGGRFKKPRSMRRHSSEPQKKPTRQRRRKAQPHGKQPKRRRRSQRYANELPELAAESDHILLAPHSQPLLTSLGAYMPATEMLSGTKPFVYPQSRFLNLSTIAEDDKELEAEEAKGLDKEAAEESTDEASGESVPTTSANNTAIEKEQEEMDELLEEVQKELHTRFKNMFEGDMLLPNLANNPEFQGKDLLSLEEGKDLLSLKEGEKAAAKKQQKKANTEAEVKNEILSLAQQQNLVDGSKFLYDGQTDNWMYARSWFIPKSYRNRENKPDENYWESGEEDKDENYVAEYENSLTYALDQKVYDEVANDLERYLQ